MFEERTIAHLKKQFENSKSERDILDLMPYTKALIDSIHQEIRHLGTPTSQKDKIIRAHHDKIKDNLEAFLDFIIYFGSAEDKASLLNDKGWKAKAVSKCLYAAESLKEIRSLKS